MNIVILAFNVNIHLVFKQLASPNTYFNIRGLEEAVKWQ